MRAFHLILLLVLSLSGCVLPGMGGGYQNDPLTGGINTQSSSLLHVQLPSGFQRYPAHSHVKTGPDGVAGLETLRGKTSANTAAMDMFNTLKAAGWQLRMYDKFKDRSVYLYEKGREYALLAFHPQNFLTILEIWLSPRLPDGAMLSLPEINADQELPSIEGEEYGPGETSTSQPGTIETWGGGSKIGERGL